MEEDPCCVPHELLLTVTSGRETPDPEGTVVPLLLERAGTVAGCRLEALPREGPRSDQGTVQPPLTLRLFVPPAPGGDPARALLKEAADRINGRRADLQHRGVAVSSAMPNWLLSTADGGGKPIGGPGTQADPAPAGRWRFEVPATGGRVLPVTPAEATEAFGQPIVVAVLDTSPGEAALRRAAKEYPKERNWLLHSLVDHNVITEWTRFSPAADLPSRRSDATPDHGLFVAGVIHSVAPHASIQLLHILDDQGNGHTALLLQALDHCLTLARQGRALVVNLSLTLMIPPDDELWSYWFETLGERVARDPSRFFELLDALDEAVEQRIMLLLDAGAVIVAAAGNDAFFYKRHAQPRLPADYDAVLCVVAAGRERRIAAYSNRGDLPFTGNCVATYGGQGRLQDGIPVVPPGPDPRRRRRRRLHPAHRRRPAGAAGKHDRLGLLVRHVVRHAADQRPRRQPAGRSRAGAARRSRPAAHDSP